jgi:hypothetical protein
VHQFAHALHRAGISGLPVQVFARQVGHLQACPLREWVGCGQHRDRRFGQQCFGVQPAQLVGRRVQQCGIGLSLAAGTGILLYTTGASSVTPAPVFVSAGMAGAALRKWALTLNRALAGRGVYAGHVAIGTWIAGTPGAPEGAPLKEPDDIACLYWDLRTGREPAEHLISA